MTQEELTQALDDRREDMVLLVRAGRITQEHMRYVMGKMQRVVRHARAELRQSEHTSWQVGDITWVKEP